MRGDAKGSLETLPSGSARATFYGPDGTRVRRTFTDVDDAELWLAEQRIAVKRGVWAPPRPPAPVLGDYARTWVAQRRNRKGRPLKPRTVDEYLRYIDRELGALAARRMDQITPADVRSWYVSLDHKPAAQGNAYAFLAAVFHTAVQDELVDRTPCHIRGGTSKDRASVTTVLSPIEVERLAQLMPTNLRALVFVAAFDCLRMGEAFALRRCDIAPNATHVTVRRAVTFTKGQVHIGDPKSAAGARTVAMPPHLVDVMLEHMRLWVGPRPDDLVFTSSRGSMLRASTLYRHFYRARDEIGRPDLRWHDLRHSGATMAAQAGATLRELQDRLGHSTVAAAMRYQHATSERDQALAQRISEASQVRLRSVGPG